MANVAASAGAVLLIIACLLGGHSCRAQVSDPANAAWSKWGSLHAQQYSYVAHVRDYPGSSAIPSMLQATINVTVDGLNVTSVAVSPITTTAANQTDLFRRMATPVRLMLENIRNGRATAVVQSGDVTPYNIVFGYPNVYEAEDGLRTMRVTIQSLIITQRNQFLVGLIAANDAARLRWERSHLYEHGDYHYTVTESCPPVNCANPDPNNSGYTKPVIVNVRGGTVINVLDAATDEPVTFVWAHYTIEQYFTVIEEIVNTWGNVDSDTFEAAYDAEMGFPTELRRTDPSGGFDTVSTTRISNAEPHNVEEGGGVLGGPRLLFAAVVVIILLLACCVGGYCYHKRKQQKKLDAQQGAVGGGASGAVSAPPQQQQQQRSGQVAYDDGPTEMRAVGGGAGGGGRSDVRYEV